MDTNFEVIFCIVNNGFSEVAMEAAKKMGARGGTVMSGRGTASKESEKFYNITIQPEKEVIMILVAADIKDNVLKGLYDAIGMDTAAQGIAFSLPVDGVVGINTKEKDK